MVTNTFPVNEAKTLIEIPKNIPQIGFLGGKQGQEIDASIKKDYKDFPVMQIGNYSEGKVRGSSPFYVVGVQSKLPFGVRVATQGDLEIAMRVGALNFSGTYEDTGLVLRNKDNPNSYLARNLMGQIKERLGKKAKMPVISPLYEMELVKNQDSPHGLSFKLKDDAEIIYDPILNESNGSKFTSENVDVKTGLPIKVGSGNRTLWTRDSGLSKLCLGGDLDLYSYFDSLEDSYVYGRVVLVSTAEGGSQAFFNQKLTELQKIRDAELAQINERYTRAEKVLRG